MNTTKSVYAGHRFPAEIISDAVWVYHGFSLSYRLMDWWTEQAEGLRGRIDRGEEFVWFAPYVDGPPEA